MKHPQSTSVMGRTVLVVGGGGREYALTIGLVESPSVDSVHVAPGNAGTSEIATNHDVSASDIDSMVKLGSIFRSRFSDSGSRSPISCWTI